MPDELSASPAGLGRALRDGVLVLVLLAGGGFLAGLAWQWLWQPPPGVVLDGVWHVDPQRAFSGTGLYVLVGAFAGLLLGVACALVADREPLLTLALVVVGSGVGGWLMLVAGTLGDPPDPQAKAAQAADRTELAGTLEVAGWSPFVAFPAGALAGTGAVFIAVSPKPADGRRHGHHAG